MSICGCCMSYFFMLIDNVAFALNFLSETSSKMTSSPWIGISHKTSRWEAKSSDHATFIIPKSSAPRPPTFTYGHQALNLPFPIYDNWQGHSRSGYAPFLLLIIDFVQLICLIILFPAALSDDDALMRKLFKEWMVDAAERSYPSNREKKASL